MSALPQPSVALPLCVDCDGTLIKTDLLHESVLLLLKTQPWLLALLPVWLLRGKAHLKEQIAARVTLDAATLPYDERVLERIRAARAAGRETVLATASTLSQAQSVQAQLGLFDRIEATQNGVNLSGERKAERLTALYGVRGFEYAGNDTADLPVWRQSAGAIVVGASRSIVKAAARQAPVLETLTRARPTLALYVKAIRAHQWLKNLLVFVPLLAAHRVGDQAALLASALAFLAFGLCASAVYVVNDLFDLASDRQHVRKRRRPFASGALPVAHGIALAPLLLLAAGLVCSLLPAAFSLTLALYFLLTSAYTFSLKNRVVVDVVVLALLYTSRLIAGSAATGILPSFWLLAFSVFLFFSLAIVKRYAELLVALKAENDSLPGRGYRVTDMPVLLSLGVGCGNLAILVLALYIHSPDIVGQYPNRNVLWLGVPLALYWMSRVWMKTHRGEMHDDPVVFAARDWQSWLVIAVVAALAAVAGRTW
ncbi:MAG TPA: UbiA family prenyltransferase [Methylibium sp.]|uniref:UbiA family prenyltransferase n=1 Tax=Methylibium sp. TaxID=2067992 RepID=UPI002DB81394|nr:UbiA family prenyltransferase [Methylibium sp.]HEU4459241.1 UbiA family prenyltransferase [Methylibium sp.]